MTEQNEHEEIVTYNPIYRTGFYLPLYVEDTRKILALNISTHFFNKKPSTFSDIGLLKMVFKILKENPSICQEFFRVSKGSCFAMISTPQKKHVDYFGGRELVPFTEKITIKEIDNLESKVLPPIIKTFFFMIWGFYFVLKGRFNVGLVTEESLQTPFKLGDVEKDKFPFLLHTLTKEIF